MGSFFGHALPGTFFYLFGIWELLNAFYYHIKYNGTQRNYMKRSIMAYSIRFCCSKNHIPIEGIIKLSCCAFGMGVESLGFFWGIPAMYQHFTMYAFFGFAGLMDILIFYNYSIPLRFDFSLHSISFFVEGILFAFHVHGRSKLDIVIHVLLVYVCYFCSIIIIFMMVFDKQLIFIVMYGIGLLVQGSWFWQAGSILYPILNNSTWCQTCPHEVMNATMIFCWHLFLNLLLAIIIYALMSKFVKIEESKLLTRYNRLEDGQDLDIEDQRCELLNQPKDEPSDSLL